MRLLGDGVRVDQAEVGVGRDLDLGPQLVAHPSDANAVDAVDAGHRRQDLLDLVDELGVDAVHEPAVDRAGRAEEHHRHRRRDHERRRSGRPAARPATTAMAADHHGQRREAVGAGVQAVGHQRSRPDAAAHADAVRRRRARCRATRRRRRRSPSPPRGRHGGAAAGSRPRRRPRPWTPRSWPRWPRRRGPRPGRSRRCSAGWAVVGPCGTPGPGHGGEGVGEVVDGVGQQGHRVAEQRHHELDDGGRAPSRRATGPRPVCRRRWTRAPARRCGPVVVRGRPAERPRRPRGPGRARHGVPCVVVSCVVVVLRHRPARRRGGGSPGPGRCGVRRTTTSLPTGVGPSLRCDRGRTDASGSTRRAGRRPNILLVVSDQERQRGWLPPSVRLPWRERLMAEGLEFTQLLHPLVAVLAEPGQPAHGPLPARPRRDRQRDHARAHRARPRDPDARLDAARRRLPVVVHRQVAPVAVGAPRHGGLRVLRLGRQRPALHGLGRDRRPLRPDHRLQRRQLARAPTPASRPGVDRQPWFLTVALVNPHDVMWFPIDQPGYESATRGRGVGAPGARARRPGRTTTRCRSTTGTTTRWSRSCPPISTTTCTPSPRRTGSGAGTSSTGCGATSTPATPRRGSATSTTTWSSSASPTRASGRCSSALEDSGAWDDTVVIFTSDHGDMCGSHGLRSKGPFVYDEIMRVPLYMRVPGVTHAGLDDRRPGHPRRPGRHHLRAGRCRSRRATGAGDGPALQGVDLSPVLADPAASVRDHVLFAQDSAQTREPEPGPLRACGGSSTARPSTPATTAWAAASRRPACGARTRATSSSTSTATSTTRTTSGTTTTPIRSSSSTWPTTGPAGRAAWTVRATARATRTQEMVPAP